MDHVRHVVDGDRPALRVARLAPEAAEDRGDEEVALLVDAEGVVEARRPSDQLGELLLELGHVPRRVGPVDLHGSLRPGPPPGPRLPLAVSRPHEEEERPHPRVEDGDRLRLAEPRQVEEVGVWPVAVLPVPAQVLLGRGEEDRHPFLHAVEEAFAAAGEEVGRSVRHDGKSTCARRGPP